MPIEYGEYVDKETLRGKIIRSKELTAMEKRYLESMMEHPTVTFGRWLIEDCDKSGMRCSECNFWKNGIRKTKYCPNCGANMCGE